MTSEALHCYRHQERETLLRCNRCERPICTACARKTPVGYRCPECVRGQQSVFETARPLDLPLAFIIAAIGVGIGSGLLSFVGFWGFFVAPVVGGLLAEAIRRSLRSRRSRHLPLVASIGGALGILPHLLIPLGGMIVSLFGGGGIGMLGSFALQGVWPLVSGALIISTLYYRLRGIRI